MTKKLLTLLLIPGFCFAVTPPRPASATYDVPTLRVLDGDTVAFPATYLPAPLKPELSVRVWGVDTPESLKANAKCPGEIVKGKAASAFTKAAVAAAKVKQVEIMTWDKYGGRVLGDVVLDGKRLSQLLIDSGNAREYYGGAKGSWCP